MRILFIRHGEPDYEHDCLTETGRLQAAAAARRLEREGIGKIYSSPNGRASETASYTARLLAWKRRSWITCTKSPGAARISPRKGTPGR